MISILCSGLIGLLLAIKAYSDPLCTTERNLIKDKDETSCVQLGLKTIPLNEIPKDTAILILKFNALKYIITSTFKGLENLVELDLSDNSLSSFQVDAPLKLEELNLANNSLKSVPKLSQLSQLTHLVLSNNRIATISDTTFAGLKHLKALELQKNQIDSLSDEVFKGTPLLDHLDLSYNRLWTLSGRLISNLVRLEKFYLTGNRLTEIPDGFFEGIENLAYVYLDKNPWNCNCALEYFKKWLEENDIVVYQIVDGNPDNDPESVLCSNGTPLLNYDMDYCLTKAKGDRDYNSVPKETQKPITVERVPMVDPTTQEPTNEPWTTPLVATTEVTTKLTPAPTTVKTTKLTPAPTTVVMTKLTPAPTTVKTTKLTPAPTTSTTELLTFGRTTTPITEPATTKLVESTWTSKARTTERTTPILTKTASQTSLTTISEARATSRVTSPTSHPTPKEEPSTMLTTTLVATTSDVSTETTVTMLIGESTSITKTPGITGPLLYSLPPARGSHMEVVGMLWLVDTILNHCCILHLFLYVLCLLLVLVQMLVYAMVLVWTYRFFHSHYKVLRETPDDIRLIRFSLRAPANDEEILLVNNDTIEPHFREQSSNGATQMLVLEVGSRDPKIRCTSVIL